MSLALFPRLIEEEFFPRVKSDVGIYEDEESILVKAPLPGIKRDQINVSLKENVLFIQGVSEEEKKMKVHRQVVNKFTYQVLLPVPIDERASIEANFEDGILSVTLPKAHASKPIKIVVK